MGTFAKARTLDDEPTVLNVALIKRITRESNAIYAYLTCESPDAEDDEFVLFPLDPKVDPTQAELDAAWQRLTEYNLPVTDLTGLKPA